MKIISQHIILTISFLFVMMACNNKKKTTGTMDGMSMPEVKMRENDDAGNVRVNSLEAQLQPTDQFVMSSVPMVTMQQSTEQIEVKALGTVDYDNRQIGAISSRVAGRIEKLYVRYRYQSIEKGEKIMDVYSPELLTSQQNLVYILRNDADNRSLINAARQRLLLLGMSAAQIDQVSRTGKPLLRVALFSNYSGYVTEPGFSPKDGNSLNNMKENLVATTQPASLTTLELPFKEGMYVEKGQQVFSVINAAKGLISLNIFSDQQHLIKKGNAVIIAPETTPGKKIRGVIEWIEPFYRPESKTLSARVYFNNAVLKLPVGSAVQASILTGTSSANWLPSSAVYATGLQHIVFKKEGPGFRPIGVTVGIRNANRVLIISGLSNTDSVAENAQHLVGSESIIKVKQ